VFFDTAGNKHHRPLLFLFCVIISLCFVHYNLLLITPLITIFLILKLSVPYTYFSTYKIQPHLCTGCHLTICCVKSFFVCHFYIQCSCNLIVVCFLCCVCHKIICASVYTMFLHFLCIVLPMLSESQNYFCMPMYAIG
jgi:hypothetical protein